MYSYTYDKKTGGLLLNSSPTGFSKEPRPVYTPELDVLGFYRYWKYDKQTDLPYMWAEANNYYYRGTLVAKLKGGNIYTAPEIVIPNGEDGKPIMPEPKGISLRPVDIEAMVEENREMLEIIEQTTVKKILAIYTKYKDKPKLFRWQKINRLGMYSTCLRRITEMPNNKYREYFDIDPMYFPQINDSSIAEDPECWKRTYPHPTFIEMLRVFERCLARQEKRSLWIQGAYGVGKSQCAYTLKRLLDVPEEELRAYWSSKAFEHQADLLEKLVGHRKRRLSSMWTSPLWRCTTKAIKTRHQEKVRIKPSAS